MGADKGRTFDRLNLLVAMAAVALAALNFYLDERRQEQNERSRRTEHLNRAWVEIKQGRLDLAQDSIELAEAGDGVTARSLAYRGYLEHRREAPVRAIPLYEDALALDPDDIFALNVLGDALRETGDFESASARLEEALALARGPHVDGGSLSSVLVSLGHLRRLQGRAREALDCYEEARGADPTNPKARVALGNFYFVVSRFREALREYDGVLDEEPENPEYLSSVARILYLIGEAEVAEEALRRSLEIRGDAPNYELLALIVRERGAEEEANRLLLRAQRFESLAHLGRLREPGATLDTSPSQ